MSKIIIQINIPEPKIRKSQAPPSKAHRDRTAYTRKNKHKKSPGDGVFSL